MFCYHFLYSNISARGMYVLNQSGGGGGAAFRFSVLRFWPIFEIGFVVFVATTLVLLFIADFIFCICFSVFVQNTSGFPVRTYLRWLISAMQKLCFFLSF